VYNLAAGGCCFEIRLPVDASGFISESDDSKRPSHPEGLDEEKENVAHSEEPVLPTLGEGEKTEEDAAHKPSVCIIEDDAELAQWLEDLFSKTFKTYVFHDGKEAYSKLTSLMPDILICDVMLPGMSGTQLCRRTKSRVETSHIPVVLLTARSGEENVLEGLKTGADSYMTKPFNIDILKAQVDSLLNSRAAFRRKFSERMSFEPSETSITPVDEKFLNRLMELIEEKMGDTAFDVSVLVDDMHMSHSIILKKVKALTGYSLVEFIRSMRIKRAAQIFRQDKLSVSEVSFMVGFSDPKYFSKCFSKEMGQKPTDFIKMHHGE
ncbi:MAG: response regulator, partial [Marinilabilia sp.]